MSGVSFRKLKQHFDNYFPLNEEELEALNTRFTERSIKRRQFVQHGDMVAACRLLDNGADITVKSVSAITMGYPHDLLKKVQVSY